jgi:hypothetical protein
MKDPYQNMMTEVMGYMLFLVCFVVALVVTGCAPVQVAPNLKLPEAKACPTLVMPPIGHDCLLDIQGDKVTANDCGDTLLRGYVRARSLLKPAAAVSSNPP